MADARIRLAGPDDEPALVELLAAALGDGMPRQTAFWRWKHVDNPFGPSLVLVAEDEVGLLGVRAMMKWRFQSGDQSILAVRPVDTATHPRAQRQGLFTRLTNAALERLAAEGASFVFNTPNEKSRPGYLKLGWRSVGRLTVWVRPGGRFSPRAGAGRFDFESSDVMVPSWSDRRLHTERTLEYLQWRYGSAPGLRYGVARDGDLSVVFRTRERFGRSELTICELLLPADPTAIARCGSLLRRVVREGFEHQAVAMAGRGTREAAVLALAGFLPARGRGPHLVVREVPGAERPPVDPERRPSWRVQVGDLEVF